MNAMKYFKLCNRKTHLDRVVICVLLIVIWGLLAVPITFHYLSKNNISSDPQCLNTIDLDNSICSNVILSHINYNTLNSSTTTHTVSVARNISKETEHMLEDILEIVDVECEDELMPFLCMYYYGTVCSENGKYYKSSYSHCTTISTGVCQDLWTNSALNLPECKEMSNLGDKSFAANNFTTDLEYNMTGSVSCPFDCAERFFCNTSSGTCVPHCPDWNSSPPTATTFAESAIAISSLLGTMAGIFVIVASCIRKQAVYTFPSILVVYETVTMLVFILLQIVTFIDRKSLYCSSPNLLETLQSPTSYCIISGVVQVAYIPMQFNIWWVTHTWVLFYSIKHPFQVNKTSTKKRFRQAHVVVTIAGVVVPTISIVAIVVYDVIYHQEFTRFGFGLVSSPPLYCSAANFKSFFYFVMFPNSVLTITGVTGLVLAIWIIHKKYGLLECLQGKHSSAIGTAEKKLLILTTYFILLEVVYFVRMTQKTRFPKEILSYFLCEQNGMDPESSCNRDAFENLTRLLVLTLFYCLVLLIPAMNFIFVVDCTSIKKKAKIILEHHPLKSFNQ